MIFTKKRIIINLLIFGIAFLLKACSYSFTGASVPSHLETISVPLVKDFSGSGIPSLAEDFTNELIQRFIDDNTLQITDKSNSDAILECTINSLSDAPSVVTGNETIETRRINISVRVIYKDLVKRETVFDRSFSNFGDYTTSADPISAREAAIITAIDKITEDILLGVVSNW